MNRRKFMKTALFVAPFSLLSARQKRARRKISFKGKISINGEIVKNINDIKVNANSKIQVEGEGSFVQFRIGNDAFKVSNNADIKFNGNNESNNVDKIKLSKGRLLAVFKTGRDRKIVTHNATMGIRGTAVFVEAESEYTTKFCTCYGKTTVSDKLNKNSTKTFKATHHQSAQVSDGEVEKTSLVYGLGQYLCNPTHTDNELRDLEAMVGRVPAFDRNGKKPFIEI